jgi:hypothetical protein
MKRRSIIVAAAAVVVPVAAWALFRPELLLVNKTVNESFPAVSVATVAAPQSTTSTPQLTGEFHKGAHDTKGTASIYKLGNGQRVLRLTNFMTSNGPDVRVLLIAASDASDNDAVKQSSPIELGKLKGNEGDQNYEIPTNVDLAKYRAVTIWCNRFSVNFGTAPLHDSKAQM